MLTVPEVAARFEVSGQAVRNWIRAGRLAAVQATGRGRFRIPVEAVEALERASSRGAVEQQRPAHGELARVVDAIVAEVQPRAVILFGSRARGEAGSDSDIDLAVVAPDGASRRQVAIQAYRSLASVRDRSVGVDIVVLTPSMIAAERDLPGSITRRIVRDGVTLYGSATLA
jgi:excisionase family DNA binding protein